jgi:hypothetical protein
MRLRRNKEPELTLDDAELILHVALELRDAMALHRRALDGSVARDDLLAQARKIAAIDRLVLIELERSDGDFATRIPETLRPFAALWPLRRLGYGLTALAQDPPDERTALSREELDALLDDEVAEWLELRLEAAPVRGWE